MVAALSFSDLEEKYAVPKPDPHEGVIVVDGLPIIPATKVPKLEAVLRKIFGGDEACEMHMCCEEDGSSKGYAFLKYADVGLAEIAVKKGNEHKLDKAHTLLVNHLKDIKATLTMKEAYEEPEVEPFEERDFLKHWLLDQRDQFAVMRQEWVSIYANNQEEEHTLIHERNNWSETYVSWSPMGTYLATLHQQGVAVWAGENWVKMARFAHANVKLIDFSPNEKYMVTWSPDGFVVGDATHHIIVWEVASGKKMRTFPYEEPKAAEGEVKKTPWPVFKWSHDDQYLARIKSNGILVYETPSMNLLDKKIIPVDAVQEICWSPTAPILSYWTPESGNIPARVTLMKIPTREILRTKNLFNVQQVKMYWQSLGEYFLTDVTQSKKKQTNTHFEIFRLKEKGIPIDVLDRKSVDGQSLVFWEPLGKKFGVLTTEGQKITANFYEMMTPQDKHLDKVEPGVEIALLHSMECRGINTISWSPQGRFCVLAGLGAFSGTLEFWDTQSFTLMSSSEHDMCTHLSWDPSGRYVTSSVSFWQVQTDTGYILWSFTGTLLLKKSIPVMKQFLWRPRPPSLLSDAKKQEIRKNFKKYSAQFDKEDDARKNKADKDITDKRTHLWQEWIAFRKEAVRRFEDSKSERIALWGFNPEEKAMEMEDFEEVVEEIIDEQEEIVE